LIAGADQCPLPTRAEDALVPGLMVALGVLTGFACAGFWQQDRLFILGASVAIGLLLVPAAHFTLPHNLLWMLPLLSLLGGASVAFSAIGPAQRL
jgi:hypothetical protein